MSRDPAATSRCVPLLLFQSRDYGHETQIASPLQAVVHSASLFWDLQLLVIFLNFLFCTIHCFCTYLWFIIAAVSWVSVNILFPFDFVPIDLMLFSVKERWTLDFSVFKPEVFMGVKFSINTILTAHFEDIKQ